MPVVGYDYKVTEQRITCPFNPAHQVPNLQKHLTKCKSFNKNVAFKQCIFNGTHYVLEPEYMHHLSICEDRHLMDRHLHAIRLSEAQKSASATGDMSQPVTWRARGEQAEQRSDVPDWDEEGEAEDWTVAAEASGGMRRVGTYDPLQATADRAIFRRPDTHMGSSERRQFRDQSAKQLSEQLTAGSSVSGGEDTVSSAVTSVFTSRHLRRPTSDPRGLMSSASATTGANPQLMGGGRGRGAVVQKPAQQPPVPGGRGGVH